MNEDKAHTVAEVADRLQVSVGTVQNLLKDDRMKGFRIRRQWRVLESELEIFMNRGEE